MLSVTGTQEVKDTFSRSLTSSHGHLLVEPLFCDQGCINGPAMPATGTVYQRRKGQHTQYSRSFVKRWLAGMTLKAVAG